jgi:hypothetical protein
MRKHVKLIVTNKIIHEEKMMNSKLIKYFAIAGMLIWCSVIFIRETGQIPDRLLHFSYIGPNLGSALALPYFFNILAPKYLKEKLASRCHYKQFLLLFVAFLLSEIVHAVFLGASFDWKDIVASIVGLGIVALVANSRDLEALLNLDRYNNG